MARKSKNKKQQTFNVYPYLGGYQHFMRNGGMLPKFEDEGQVNVSASELFKKIRPTNTDQDYPNTLKGAVKEFNEHFGNRDDRSKYNTLGGLGRLGLLGNVVQGVNQGVKNVRTAFDKDSYTPGGKYSKFDETGALRFADVKLTNTTDQNALLHGENFSKYLGMSKKEREKWIESGGRNTDLWWSTDDLQYGKYNYMDRNEDGTPKFDGINYRQIKARNEMYKNPDTGESLFAIKNKNKDGTFTYFNPDGSIDYNKSTQTQYDLIEEGTGPGGLADVNAQTMIFDFDKEGENKLAAFSGFNEQTTTTGVCSDGASLTEESCVNAGGTWTTDTKTEKVNPVTEYDPDTNFGNYTTTTTSEETRQQRLNREAQEGSGEDDTLRYGAELRKMLTRYDAGGVADDNLNDSTAYWDKFDNPGDPVFQEGGQNEDEEENPDDKKPDANPYGFGSPQGPINITPGTPEDYNDSLIESIESKQNPDPNQPPEELLIPGVDFDPMENVNNFEVPNAPKPPDRTDQNVIEGQATEEQQNMGIDVSYGKGPIQKTYNKVREATNTGVLGAALDIYGGASEFAVDKLAPFLSSFAEGQDRHEAKLKQRSMSAEDFAPMMEETAGTGAKGFYDVNKGGYGDDLYGTGEIYGQVQEGKELINQNPDLSGVLSYMPSDKDQLAFNKEHLEKQKEFLGKMKNGGQLPKYQALGQVSNAKKFLNYINPFKFKPTDNVFFSLGQTSQEPFTKINFNAGEDIAGFLNVNYRNKLGPSVEMVSVPEEYRNMGVATALYDKAIQEAALGVNNKASAKYPGLISGETLDNPEATINIWKHFDLDVQNTERTKMDKLLGKNKWKEEDGTTDFSSFIKDGKYEGPLVRLKGLNKKGETKVSEFRKFYDELSAEDKIMYNMTAKNVGGTTWNDIHSPLGRYIANGFRTKNKIGDGKHFKDYNKLPLYLTLGGLAYRTFSGDGLDDEVQEKERLRYLNERAKEEGFKNADDFIKHLSDTTRKMNMESETYDYYKDSVDDLYRRGGQYEMPEYLRGGGTASEGAVLCDAYDKPIDPEKAWAADVNNNYKGPGMKYGGTLPKFQGLKRSEVKDYSKAWGTNKRDTKDIISTLMQEGYNSETDTIISSYHPSMPIEDQRHGQRMHNLAKNVNSSGLLPFMHSSSANFAGELGATYPFVDATGYGSYLAIPKMNEGGNWFSKAVDYGQTALGAAGLTPGPVGLGADAINTGISGIRAGYNKFIGDDESAKKHTENMALNATSMIPGPAGWAAGASGLAKDMAGYAGAIDDNKSITTQVADSMKTKPSQPTMAVKGTSAIDDTAKLGGEQEAEIDMDLYYELMKAGADIKILG